MHWGRTSAGIVAMLFAAWTAGSDWTEGIQYEPAIGLFIALGAWLGFEFAGREKQPAPAEKAAPAELSPNDLRLGRRLRAAFPDQTRRFLRDHSFGQPYHDSRTDPLNHLISEWKGAYFEFDDYDLRLAASSVVTGADEFIHYLSMHGGSADRWGGRILCNSNRPRERARHFRGPHA